MNAEELWETTMDPARRVLLQVNVNDAHEADNVFDMLMGNDVSARKSFITHTQKRRHWIFKVGTNTYKTTLPVLRRVVFVFLYCENRSDAAIQKWVYVPWIASSSLLAMAEK